MKTRTPVERLRSRRWTWRTLLPWAWAAGVALSVFGFKSCGYFYRDPADPTAIRYTFESNPVSDAIFWTAVTTGAVLWWLRKPTRRGSLKARGWEHRRRGADRFERRFGLHPFRAGRKARIRECAWGEHDGRGAAAFTFWRGRRHFYDVTLVELPARLPSLALVPAVAADSLADAVAGSFAGTDLRVESAEFNRRWRVFCDDARYAHAVLHPRIIARLCEDDAEGLPLSIDGGAVLCWVPGRDGLDELDARLALLGDMAGLVPDFVVKDYA